MKRMLLTITTLSVLSLFVAECAAQENTAEASTTTAPKIVLREGTEISLKIAQNVNSRTARQDDVVEFVLAASLKVGDAVVADVGSRAIGTVIHSVKPNFAGDPGELTVRLTFLKVGKVKVPIRGTTLRAGDYRVVIRGSQATIKMGTPMTAYVDADVEVEPLTPVSSRPSTDLTSPIQGSDSATRADDKVRLSNGTLVRLLLTEPLSSKTARVGDPVKLQALDDVRVGDLIVIANKAPAFGVVIEAQAAGLAWRKGGIILRIDSVTLVTGASQPIGALNQATGPPTHAVENWMTAIGESRGLAMFALPFAPLQHGNQAKFPRAMVFETVTQGEAWLDRSAVEASQPKDVAVGSGLASVTFYYPNSERSHFHEIWCGSKRLGNLKHGRRITMKLPAGEYSCRLRKNAPTAVFDLQAGCEYYVRLGFLQAVSSVAGEVTGFTVVPHDVGELEAIDTQAASPKDFREIAEMDLSLLQTDPLKQ